MDDTELRLALEKLHHELEHTKNLDDESRQRLQHLMGDIRLTLQREGSSPPEHYESLGGQLSDGIQRYEVSHPNLAVVMKHALDILSGMGI